jgi:hypothetical protein
MQRAPFAIALSTALNTALATRSWRSLALPLIALQVLKRLPCTLFLGCNQAPVTSRRR